MTTVRVRRRARPPAPPVPDEPVDVDAPPELARPAGSRWTRALTALPMLGGAVAMALMFSQGAGAHTYLVAALFAVSGVAMLATSWSTASGTPGRAELAAARRDYLRYLSALRGRLHEIARAQHTAAHYRHPDPGTLWNVTAGRLWEVQRDDPDFGDVRVAIGSRPLAAPLRPAPAGEEAEPATEAARQRLLDAYQRVDGLPVTLSALGLRRARLLGNPDAAAGLGRALLAQLATFHGPDAVLIAVCAGPQRRDEWEWVKWLPHNGHPALADAVGPVRLVASTMARLATLLADLPDAAERPHLLVVRDAAGDHEPDGQDGPFAPSDGVTVLDIDAGTLRAGDPAGGGTSGRVDPVPPGPGEAVIEIGAQLRLHTADGPSDAGTPDLLSVAEAETLARRLASLRPDADRPAGSPTSGRLGGDATGVAFTDLLGVSDPDRFDPATAWAPRPDPEHLRVPIGTDKDGSPVLLDLKESAAGGDGPHGLLIGATGSGKSELLRTLVLGLAATHSSEDLNLVLIDFKGGATFASLGRLPHTAAVITNLADELPLVDRMTDALNGELVRRQELLRSSGNHAGRAEYERARQAGAPLAPLPVLLVVCDEFSELLAAKPDFIDLFVQIGRLGRSLGVHLLLASQRLEEGRLRGLDSHLSYRIGLRSFSTLESRTVLGVPDAYELPREPGHGYLRTGTEELVRFRAGYVSGPWRRRRPTRLATSAPGPVRVLPFGTRQVPATASVPAPPDDGAAVTGSLLDLLVERMTDAGPPAHRVWLPPLVEPPTLEDLLGPPAADPARGLSVTDRTLTGALRVPVALVDRPLQQRRDPLWLSLDGAAGHVAVIGGPRAGKSTLLATLICGLALTHTPAEAQIYCLDFGGGSLATLRGLPHVGGVAGRLDPAAVRRTVGEAAALLATREHHGYGGAGADRYGDVFLVVDGWTTLRHDFEDLEPVITDLATRGLSYGIHVVVSASRWLDLRPPLRDVLSSRVELRLGETADSMAGRRAADTVPEGVPGRGITADGLHLLTALPHLTGGDTADLVAGVAGAWTGPLAPPVRLLPAQVRYEEIAPTPAGGDVDAGLRLPIGIAEADLRPVHIDLANDPHLVVFGDTECGKSSFLRSLAASMTRLSPEHARIVLVDYRRSLLEAVTTDHLIGYGTSAEPTAELCESVAGYLADRLPGPDVTPAQLRERSWWSGPDCVVLVDDYDLVAAGTGNPLLPLLPYLAHARDVGLHLVLARRSGGAARAMYEPMLQRLRELSAAGLVMSGDPDEGALVGAARPAPMPAGRGWLVTRRAGVRLVQLAMPPGMGEG